ncbi:MAG: DUF1684 domain-containing protein [Candidatus Dormibacteria bacterium]
MGASSLQENLELVDWRQRVAALYQDRDRSGVAGFRARRDELFKTHPQSPIPAADRSRFRQVDYFPEDPSLRVESHVESLSASENLRIETGGPDGTIEYQRVALAHFSVAGAACALTIFSIVGYGGGLFLPFRDATSGHETYGGGRYLFDTIKNHVPVPLPTPGSKSLVLDFNYAYNPSCAYDHRWACPLAPRENWLEVRVAGGERTYSAA